MSPGSDCFIWRQMFLSWLRFREISNVRPWHIIYFKENNNLGFKQEHVESSNLAGWCRTMKGSHPLIHEDTVDHALLQN